MSKDLVAVGFCYGQTTVTPQWRRSYTMLLQRDAYTERRVVAEFAHEVSGVHIPHARCEIVRSFLAHPMKPAWLWMVDTDATFADDVLERLIASADPDKRPIVGALAFGVAPRKVGGVDAFNKVLAVELDPFPTIYCYDESGTVRFDIYPPDRLVQCHATGAHCLLIHRSVLEDERWQDGHPLPWFRTAVRDGDEVSEDQFFCMKAGSMGYPVHVDTSIKTGHVKTFVADEDLYLRRFMPPPATERVTVIVPVLHRPQNVRPLVESLRASTGLADVWFVCEPDDPIEWAEVEKCGARRLVHPGTFAQKVNFAAREVTTPWVFLVGDDGVFHPGWLDHAQAIAKVSGAKLIGTNDLGNPRVVAGEHATHMLIATDYIRDTGASWDGPGIVCHEGYRHWYVDDELVTAAKQRGVWAMARGSIVEHNHPAWGKAQDDDVYRLGQSHAEADRKMFEKRMAKYVAA